MLNYIQNNKKYTKALKDKSKQKTCTNSNEEEIQTHLKYIYFKYINNKKCRLKVLMKDCLSILQRAY